MIQGQNEPLWPLAWLGEIEPMDHPRVKQYFDANNNYYYSLLTTRYRHASEGYNGTWVCANTTMIEALKKKRSKKGTKLQLDKQQ